jgi:hypothetical protein
MEIKSIESLIDGKNNNIDYEKLHYFMSEKLNDLYNKGKTIPLGDYQDIKNSAIIDFIYEILPSLKEGL